MNAFTALDALETGREPLLCHMDPPDRDPASEIVRQTLFLSRLRLQAPTVMAWAVPNAGKRGIGAQRQIKREGVKKGCPDLTITWNRGVAFVEWKAGKTYPDADQREFLNRLYRVGHHVGVFRQPDSALAWLRERGAPIRGGDAQPFGEVARRVIQDAAERVV